MIIEDQFGGTLSLTKTKLTERTGMSTGDTKYYINLVELYDNKPVKIQQTPETHSYSYVHTVIYVPGKNFLGKLKIGCRYFSSETYTKIMKAAIQARKDARLKGRNGKSK